VGIFSFFSKSKPVFSAADSDRIIAAIREAEKATSGEVRVFIERKNPLVSTLERAAEVFYELKMQETDHRNGVLLYLATDHHEVALFGDEGIHKALGSAWWEKEVQEMLQYFRQQDLATGMVHCISHVGRALQEKFPYEASTDRNELPDEIIFGK
jgi:uncharacterized membrane protein